MMTKDPLFETDDDFLGAMRQLEALDSIAPASPAKQASKDEARIAAARSGNQARCKELGIHLCTDCGGSGRYRGVRVHQPKGQCFPCNGRGYFMRSYADRLASRQKEAAKANERKDRIRAEIDARSPGMAEWLAENSGWCNIAASVLDMLNRGKEPSERQVEAIVSIRIKTEKTRAEKAAAKAAAQAKADVSNKLDFSKVRAMMQTAKDNGLKNPVFRFAGLAISRAKDTSTNPGCLYIKTQPDGTYAGKITPEGIFRPAYGMGDVIHALREIEADPLGAAIKHGRQTGFCACCGKLLVNDSKPDIDGLTSVERGIGPVCGRRFGFIF